MIGGIVMLGQQLKMLREIKGKSQQEVCTALNIEQSTLANYENDKRIPKLEILIKLAEYYNVSVDCLLGLKKVDSNENCYNYFYEEGLVNWNIRKKSEELGITYDNALARTDIERDRFDQLWYGNSQPYAEELIRFAHVLDVSVDYLLDESQKDKLTNKEAMVLNYYSQYPDEVLDLLGAFCSLNRKQRTIIIGKCFELEDSSSVAADEEPTRKAVGK